MVYTDPGISETKTVTSPDWYTVDNTDFLTRVCKYVRPRRQSRDRSSCSLKVRYCLILTATLMISDSEPCINSITSHRGRSLCEQHRRYEQCVDGAVWHRWRSPVQRCVCSTVRQLEPHGTFWQQQDSYTNSQYGLLHVHDAQGEITTKQFIVCCLERDTCIVHSHVCIFGVSYLPIRMCVSLAVAYVCICKISLCLSACLPVNLSIRLSMCQDVCCVSVCMHVCL